jgi:uncharacterized membrane protein YqjE
VDGMKLRLIVMGCMLTVLGVVFLVVKDFSTALIGLIAIGVVLAIVGVVWKPRKKPENVQR